MLKDVPCPRCGKILYDSDSMHHYVFCNRIGDEGCNEMFATSVDCYFNGIYVLNSVGEVIAYKQTIYEGGRVIRTNKLLPKYKGWKIRY